MDKPHVSRPSHLLQVVPAQVWILIQGNISTPSSLFGAFRSWRLSSSHRLGHWARPHRQRLLIKTRLMITPRSGKVLVWTLLKRATSSLWWPRLEGLHRTAPTDIPPSGDQKHPYRTDVPQIGLSPPESELYKWNFFVRLYQLIINIRSKD
jgi:hypothetical protein